MVVQIRKGRRYFVGATPPPGVAVAPGTFEGFGMRATVLTTPAARAAARHCGGEDVPVVLEMVAPQDHEIEVPRAASGGVLHWVCEAPAGVAGAGWVPLALVAGAVALGVFVFRGSR